MHITIPNRILNRLCQEIKSKSIVAFLVNLLKYSFKILYSIIVTKWLDLHYSFIYRDDLSDLSDEYFKLSDTLEIELQLPDYSQGPMPDRIRAMHGTHEIHESFVCSVLDTKLIGRSPVAVKENKIFNEVRLSRRDKLEKDLIREPLTLFDLTQNLIRLNNVPSKYDLVCSFASVGSGYCGWVQSNLPQLNMLNQYQTKTNRELTILLPPNPPDWMIESIEYFGYCDQWEEWDSRYSSVEELVIPSLPTGERRTPYYKSRPPFQYDDKIRITNPILATQLRRDSHKLLDDEIQPNSRRIYISRKLADGREVQNRNKIMAILKKYGFKEFCFEELEFKEQVKIMAEADIIIGPHGAGLVNMVFCPDDVTIIELFGSKKKPTFYTLAKCLDLNYGYVICEPTGKDMVADINEIEDLINKMITDDK